ncbi:hypothetical protein MM236_19050 [Belliella sp. DSM 107340]|uniref:Uncharacterized protein n=1 Tax=Belliella calami TaxID=2923436 RepID=A0ABS9UU15_9BACT|nr:hypothetical protein [Belliella calami]MCH7400101.1 hypothetical protein [Belliella calami]
MIPQEHIDDVLNHCADMENSGKTDSPGMSYEQGVKDAILWVTGETNVCPIDKED